ncbi:MAG: hypothetical protein IKV13_05460 [Akkermansia sp.]|nr:hypothetical protein [Akkermansia sp.]
MKTVINQLPNLLEHGFTEKFAKYYLDALKQEKETALFDAEYMQWAHSHGFLAEHATGYGLNESNYHEYLSDYEFYRSWPLNSWARIWVNDKLTLKHMLAGSEFEYLLPRYYYYSMPNGLRPSLDNHLPNPESLDTFIQLLKAERDLACKPNNDTMSKGFCHMEYKNDEFYINGSVVTEKDIKDFVLSHPNYVFQEYLRPSQDFSLISPLIHTLRILVINENGVDPQIVRSYLRFPSKCSGEANYVMLDGKNPDVYTLYADVDVDTGRWGDAKLIYAHKIQNAAVHPDSGGILNGHIADFDTLCTIIKNISKRFNTCEYMGFDIGITDKGFRMMEINTHPEIRGFQYFRSMYATPFIKEYFSRKLAAVDALTDTLKTSRHGIQR